MRNHQDAIDEFDRHVREYCRDHGLNPGNVEEYVAGYRAVVMAGGPHVEAYAGRPNTVDKIEADLVRIGEELERLVAEYPRLKP